ncbi:MAG: leucine-rich repeat domain-containing protein, partial [Peptococcaceae bacterium]|nr:leucine-rich repeat domain-containing protein [Peptococcaceae bacterium]
MDESRISRYRKQQKEIKRKITVKSTVWLCAMIAFVGFAGILATERYLGLLAVPMAGDGTAATATSMSAREANNAGFVWKESGGGISITGYGGLEMDLVVPYEIDGMSVTCIGDNAFANCWDLTSVVIPDSVTGIGFAAFRDCTRLTNMDIPSSVSVIGGNAFAGSGLISVIIPEGVSVIDSALFMHCDNLTSVYIPDSVTRIGYSAFEDCSSLTGVVIPKNVIDIASGAFSDCPSLTEFTVDDDNSSFSSQDGVLFNKDRTKLIQCPAGKSGDYVIPDGVTNIESSAFFGCSRLTNVHIPVGVTDIGIQAFSGCDSLTSVSLPEGLTAIKWLMFRNCTSLTDVAIPESIVDIDFTAFSGCTNLTNITVAGNNASFSILDGVFYDKNQATLIRYPASKSGEFIIPDGVTGIAGYAFENCTGLTNVIIPDSVTSIGNNAFSNCANLINVTIPGSVNNIGDYAFLQCAGLTNLVIQEGVNSIGRAAFEYCSSLTRVHIPASVAIIDDSGVGDSIFSNCANLTDIAVHADNASFSSQDGILFDKNKNKLILCPDGKTGEYIVPDSVVSIGHNAFHDCVGLTGVVIPEGVTVIEDQAFGYCDSLTSVVLPEGLVSIGSQAFFGDDNLRDITIPDSVTSIGGGAFTYCISLTDVRLPKGMTGIEVETFMGCSRLEKVFISSGITSISDSAFEDCRALNEVIIGHGMIDLPLYFLRTIYQAPQVNIHIPTSVISVGGAGPFVTTAPLVSFAENIALVGVKDSFILDWAKANNRSIVSVDGSILPNQHDAWIQVPYQHIIDTMMPDNVELTFEIVNGTLPDGLRLMQANETYEGLTLLSGQFYGAPMETGTFVIEVETYSAVYGYTLDRQLI